MAVIPAANTSAAQMAAPRSCGGRAGQIHGVVQCAASTDAVYGTALLISGRATRKQQIPFGPFMIAGAFLAVLLS
jgi:hypothetical protein